MLVALLVCLIPTTIGALLSAIGIAGMDRLVQRNVLAMSGRAVEAAGDVATLLLDKTGTITYGNRMAAAFLPVARPRRTRARTRRAACRSLADETPEGRSIVDLAEVTLRRRPRDASRRRAGAVHRPDAHVGHRLGRTARPHGARRAPLHSQGSGRFGRAVGRGAGRPRPGRPRADRRGDRAGRRHPARRRREARTCSA